MHLFALGADEMRGVDVLAIGSVSKTVLEAISKTNTMSYAPVSRAFLRSPVASSQACSQIDHSRVLGFF